MIYTFPIFLLIALILVGQKKCCVDSFSPPFYQGRRTKNTMFVHPGTTSTAHSDNNASKNSAVSVPVNEESSKKKKSKFSQLMSGEQIKSAELLENEELSMTFLLKSDEDIAQNVLEKKWSFSWRENGIVQSLPKEAPNSDYPPSLFTCSLPDDDFNKSSISPPDLHNKREIHYIPSLLTPQQVQSLLNAVKFNIQSSNSSSIHHTTKCIVAVEDGERQYQSKANNDLCVTTILEPIIQHQILPTARSICQEPNLVIADSLVRWYIAEEKEDGGGGTQSTEALSPHYDVTSFATMIIPLNPEECEGGLYVQYGAGIETRCTVDFKQREQGTTTTSREGIANVEGQGRGHGMKRGDAILHRYDVMHGVQLQGGTRYSLVLWMAQDEKSMRNLTVPWVTKDAQEKKSVHAAFLHGLNAKEGIYGVQKDLGEAKFYWEWAAKRGHALSQYNLAMLLLKVGFKEVVNENGLSKAEQKQVWEQSVLSLLEQSANRGLDMAQHALGIAYRQGYYGLERDTTLARQLYLAAAKQGYVRSIEALAYESTWNSKHVITT